ncbi:MAG: PilZ domain-containing protein [Spirochaetales bacterium]|nr:PilZ domain-containing protein [Spirochaetales bacterium]
MNYIVYKGNCYTELFIHFSPKLNGSDFFKILELIDFPVKESDNIILRYALTELVTNSLRALHERKIDKEVSVDLMVSGNFLKIIVTDFGGGFDLSTLPIDINDESKKPDFTSLKFQEYRERHGFNRFGIGLLSAKIALDAFHLVFIDREGKECAWKGGGSVAGTRITAAKRMTKVGNEAEVKPVESGMYLRRLQRHSIFTKAVVNNSIDGYLIDISTEGAKLLLLSRDSLEQGGIISVQVDAVGGIGKKMVFCAVVRWLEQEKAFWQIGSEFVRDASFPREAMAKLVKTVNLDPRRLGGLVVIEGT